MPVGTFGSPLRHLNDALRLAGEGAVSKSRIGIVVVIVLAALMPDMALGRGRGLHLGPLGAVMQALDFMPAQQAPYPALVVDRLWNLVMANEPAAKMMRLFLGMPAHAPIPRDGSVNVLKLILDPNGLAQSVSFVTGHGAADSEPDLDWAALARPNHTVAIYMGLSAAAAVSQRLMRAGRDGATPALIVVNASRADEQRVAATLGTLADVAQTLTGPAILVVGEAMSLADVGEAPAINEILLEAAR